MFLDDTQKQNGAVSQNEPPAGGSTGGAAPEIVGTAAVDSPGPTAQDWLDAFAKVSGISIAPRPDNVEVEAKAFVDVLRKQPPAFAPGFASPAIIMPPPGGADFEAAMAAERASQADYFSNLIDTIGPKVVALAKQARAESAAPLDKATHEQLVSDCEAVAVAKATQISEQAKNDTILGVNMLLKPILEWFKGKKDAPPQAAAGDPGVAPAVPRAIVEGDQVKVWTDAVKKTFILGSVETVHDAAHSFDVLLEDGTVAHVQAGNLALDDLAH